MSFSNGLGELGLGELGLGEMGGHYSSVKTEAGKKIIPSKRTQLQYCNVVKLNKRQYYNVLVSQR